MVSFEEDGSWSVSFVGAGFLALYHVGATQCMKERAPRLFSGTRRFYGSSSGALQALAIVSGKSVEFCCTHLLGMVRVIKGLSLGIFHPAFAPIEHITWELQENLPADAHILASKQLGISLTRWSDGKNVIVTEFATREELIQAMVCTLYLPLYCGVIPPEFRGERYFDGAISNNMPLEDKKSTITVAPFPGKQDICPQSPLAGMREPQTVRTKFQLYLRNALRVYYAIFPPSPEVVADICRQGYLDTLRFLERRGLTKEPILWTLASMEPPAPAEGTQDSVSDENRKAGPPVNWEVPNVLVKDVPNFEQLSPELEAALRKACREKRGLWARFRRSSLGQVMTYLLLPYTLPVEYVFFRCRRVLAWLPDAPRDLRWMQGVLRDLAGGLFSRSKAQLLGAVRPPSTRMVVFWAS
ncbi:patatin-like phospholipase domain-containing protein 5 [Echinops telfairi]|uniref:Patatin-like phospholipase domain-containing protein 5 n=1 Tax=Echinops telfairi TaxID=9371 RepID=A0ABM0IIE3_ECHTE|nr:patatin-like phospholipase domain-containing protein 5 [Echinops telfairi]